MTATHSDERWGMIPIPLGDRSIAFLRENNDFLSDESERGEGSCESDRNFKIDVSRGQLIMLNVVAGKQRGNDFLIRANSGVRKRVPFSVLRQHTKRNRMKTLQLVSVDFQDISLISNWKMRAELFKSSKKKFWLLHSTHNTSSYLLAPWKCKILHVKTDVKK